MTNLFLSLPSHSLTISSEMCEPQHSTCTRIAMSPSHITNPPCSRSNTTALAGAGGPLAPLAQLPVHRHIS